MWKQLIAACLMLAFSASTFCSTVMLLNMYRSQAAYARSCINKARPQMHCNGKCQMMKRLQQEEKKDQNLPIRKPDSKQEELIVADFETGPLFAASFTRLYSLSTVETPIDQSYILLRPPRALHWRYQS